MHWVNPFLALTHVITTRELAFDVPVAAVRSSDGVNVNVDLVLTLGIEDPVKFAYTITTGDLDQFIHADHPGRRRARSSAASRRCPRSISGPPRRTLLRATIDAKLASYGVGVRDVAFTRVMLPDAITASLEARRLAAIQLSEEEENYALEERRLNDRANLHRARAGGRATRPLEHEAAGRGAPPPEARRAARGVSDRRPLRPRAAAPQGRPAARGNSRAVVSMGGNDLVPGLLVGGAASSERPGRGAAPTPAPAATRRRGATGRPPQG